MNARGDLRRTVEQRSGAVKVKMSSCTPWRQMGQRSYSTTQS